MRKFLFVVVGFFKRSSSSRERWTGWWGRMERDEEDNGRNEGTWRGTKLTMKLRWLSVCFLVMHSSCRQPFAHNNYNRIKMPNNSSRWVVLISVVLFLVHIVCSLTFMLIKIEMQCNATGREENKKNIMMNELLSWKSCYFKKAGTTSQCRYELLPF